MSKKKHTRVPRHIVKKNTSSIGSYILVIALSVFFFFIAYLYWEKRNQLPLCANSRTCTSDLSIHITHNVPGFFDGQKVSPPVVDLTAKEPLSVLGVSTVPGEKHIYVDLSTQILTAYQGTTQILKTWVSTGKWAPTPVGNFHIWTKLRSTLMAGGEGADAYYLPNVQYVMYFYQDYGLHQAYWHDNFGHPMSHGCVNLRLVDAKTLYGWADGPDGSTPGTAVSICNQITSDHQCIQDDPIQ